MTRHASLSAALGLFACASMLAASACGAEGGPVPTKTTDAHCSDLPPQATTQSVCTLMAGQRGGSEDASDSASDYSPPLAGTAGDDDDCKYHITWSSTPIHENQKVTVTVVATNKTDASPVTGADTIIEAYLNETHPAPNQPTKTVEGPPGTYTISPIEFDAPGKWIMRFHLFEQCSDLDPRSPHGHAAFYVEVP